MKKYSSFSEAIKNAKFAIYQSSEVVKPKTWQSIDVSKRPEMTTHEVTWWGFSVDVPDVHLTEHQLQILPNLPWADDHFAERVCGYPLNPGLQWSKWPWAFSADKFRAGEMFNHTYAERYWPKVANIFGPKNFADDYPRGDNVISSHHTGIRYNYGDLNDVVGQLARDPLTRQAILPVFFPEDTGAVHGGRVPCSIHYHFMARQEKLDIFYYLRSCDFVRHFRDDIYLTLRLQLWMIERLKGRGIDLVPGQFHMMIGSLHIFANDWRELYGTPYAKNI